MDICNFLIKAQLLSPLVAHEGDWPTDRRWLTPDSVVHRWLPVKQRWIAGAEPAAADTECHVPVPTANAAAATAVAARRRRTS